MELDGSGDYMSNDDLSEFGPDATVEGWIYPTSLTGEGWLWRINRTVSSGSGYYAVRVNNGELQAFFGNQTTTATATVPADTWTHVAVTYEETVGVQIYIDGSPSGSPATWPGTGTIGPVSSALIGTESGGANFFAGLMDEIRIVDGLLTPSEIANDAQNSIVPPPSIVSFTEVGLQDTIALEFDSEAGRTYRLQAAPVVEGPYTDQGIAVDGDGTALRMFDPSSTNGVTTGVTVHGFKRKK